MAPRVVVVGGGYAGMAAIIALRQSVPGVEIHLLDPSPHHLKLIQLHETVHRPLSDLQHPFAVLGKRFEFTHHPVALSFTPADLSAWQDDRVLPLPEGDLPFDYLVIATGAKPRSPPNGEEVYGQEHFREHGGRAIIQTFLARSHPGERVLSIVGGGPTGLQFLFEIEALFRRNRVRRGLRLIDSRSALLPALPAAFHRYLVQRLSATGIEYLPQTRFLDQRDGAIHLEDARSGAIRILPSDLTLAFPGVTPYPRALSANRYGRVRIGDKLLWNVFAVGDCSRFDSHGLNALTAQAAVRKGKQIAHAIKRIEQGRLPRIYAYREVGYMLSLGPVDALGWVYAPNIILSGLAARAVRATVEARYDLFLDGVDTYF